MVTLIQIVEGQEAEVSMTASIIHSIIGQEGNKCIIELEDGYRLTVKGTANEIRDKVNKALDNEEAII